ncbi:MAG: alginate lyase family protein [Prevotella sp.]|nr:alginate lyase family protein [Prevotella sp.]
MKRFSFFLLTVFLLMLSTGLKAQDQTIVNYNDQRGFRHPGGLHTQDDFDRIKTQLAAGNEKVTQAYNVLKNAAYAQPGVQSNPVETIVRGGGSGENYINAARGATMAYQNAVRWKIEGNTACANAAVRILMAWANKTTNITGNSDAALAVGLYGYQFAQAAELMRDYEGWSLANFEKFKHWMLDLWYPKAINFLRVRNGTWENSSKWWQAPGHYWSNWGLCNIMCVISIGILCDDVFIYNQGMSFFKYDQVGTYKDPRTDNPIKNDGLTDFLGNLVVTTVDSPLETGAYGQIGQMNESGRDTGHSAMALGLAIDIAKVGWNQGDDLFAYMKHRLAAGIEYVAAQTQSVENLPWTNYHYATNGFYYTDSRSWLMTEPALGAQTRPYWGTVIGIYEGVKGVQMPFSKTAYEEMGIDEGGQGGTSGGYDHMGYSVLMNTREPQLAPADKVPTELSAKMEYSAALNANLIPSYSVERTLGNINGKVFSHSELGGLVNTFTANSKTCLPKGQTLTLMPQLPEGEEDTGLWSWNTGETTRNITVSTNKSFIYRVTYTNQHGVKSEQMFSLAAEGDCRPSKVTGSIIYNGTVVNDTTLTVFYGDKVTLKLEGTDAFSSYLWFNGKTTATVTTPAITKDTVFVGAFINQGGARSEVSFHLKVKYIRQDITVNGTTSEYTEPVLLKEGDKVLLGPYVPDAYPYATYQWNTGATTRQLLFEHIDTTGVFTVDYTLDGVPGQYVYDVTTLSAERPFPVPEGNYLIRHRASDTFLYFPGLETRASFKGYDDVQLMDSLVWHITEPDENRRLNFQSVVDGSFMGPNYRMSATPRANPSFTIEKTAGAPNYAICNSVGWYISASDAGGVVNSTQTLSAFPFELIPYDGPLLGIQTVPAYSNASVVRTDYYNLQGQQIGRNTPGIIIVRKQLSNGRTKTILQTNQ